MDQAARAHNDLDIHSVHSYTKNELDYFTNMLSLGNLSDENVEIVNQIISHLLHAYTEPVFLITV